MKILFLTPQFPYPPHKGTTMRNYYLIANLAARHEVDLLTFVESDEAMRESPLHAMCRRIESIPVPRRSLSRRAADTLLSPWPDMGLRLWSHKFVEKLGDRSADTDYDVIQVEGIELARYMLRVARRKPQPGRPQAPAPGPQTIFDNHNCEYLLQQRTFETDLRIPKRWLGAMYSLVQWRKLRAFEASVCRAADRVLAVSNADAAALRRLAPGLDVTVIPNGIDAASYALLPTPPLAPPSLRDRREGTDLVFTGTMDFRPNVDAALWFAHEVMPLIREQEPRARFVIVGQKPHRRLNVLRGRPEVLITGAVDDARPYIASGAVYVVPLRMGGGTRFKILEAAALGKAMVSTSLGCEGFPVQNGRDLVIADSPREFADAVVQLVHDPARRAELGACARRLADEYDWNKIIPRMEMVYAGRRNV
jgi:glycosyltransferase involved in cell wall biosynthesis